MAFSHKVVTGDGLESLVKWLCSCLDWWSAWCQLPCGATLDECGGGLVIVCPSNTPWWEVEEASGNPCGVLWNVQHCNKMGNCLALSLSFICMSGSRDNVNAITVHWETAWPKQTLRLWWGVHRLHYCLCMGGSLGGDAVFAVLFAEKCLRVSRDAGATWWKEATGEFWLHWWIDCIVEEATFHGVGVSFRCRRGWQAVSTCFFVSQVGHALCCFVWCVSPQVRLVWTWCFDDPMTSFLSCPSLSYCSSYCECSITTYSLEGL